MRQTIKPLLLVLTMLGALGLTACNTVAGAGQDISDGGHALSHGANNVKNGS